MKNSLFRKILVIGTIILFVGASAVSNISGDIKNQDVQAKENLDNSGYPDEYEGKLEKYFNDPLEKVQEHGRSYDWPTLQHDMQRTGFTSGIGEITSPSIKWRYTGDNFHSSPAIGDIDGDGETEVIFVSNEGAYAFDGRTGVLEWHYNADCNSHSHPTLDDVDDDGDIEVVFGANGNCTYCLDGTTGAEEWIHTVPDTYIEIRSPVVGDIDNDGNQEIIVNTDVRDVYCLRGSDGTQKWDYHRSAVFHATSPSLCDVDSDNYMEIFFVGADITCLNGFDGSQKWEKNQYYCDFGAPSLGDIDDDGDIELVFGGCDYPTYGVFCLNAATGQEEWRFAVDEETDYWRSPAIGDIDNDGKIEVVITCRYIQPQASVYCLDGSTGNEEWNYTVGNVRWSPPALGDIDGDGKFEVVLGCRNGGIYCLSGENGSEQWNLSLEKMAQYPPALGDIDGDGKIEIAIATWNSHSSHDDRVYVLDNDFGPQPPVVIMNGPYRAADGEEILFDASESYDPDGYIVGYRWDWTNDGVWDTGWLTSPSTTHTYYSAFIGNVRLEVKDNENLTNSATEHIQIDETPPITWDKTFGSGDSRSVQQINDGGYILTGEKSDDIFLLKTDSKGNEQWMKYFDGSGFSDRGHCVQQTTDGGYIVVGWTAKIDDDCDVWLIKTDSDGNEEWNKTFGTTSDSEFGESVNQTSDGGYTLIMWSKYGKELFLIKTDNNGNEEWNKLIDSGYGRSVKQTSDGGYIIGGTCIENDNYKACIIKTFPNGDIQWKKTFGYSHGYEAQLTLDGGYIFTGSNNFLIKTDSNGNEEWNTSFGGHMGYSVEQTTDEGYIIGGKYTREYPGKDCIVKTYTNGDLEWRKIIDETHCDRRCKTHQTFDNGYIALTSTIEDDIWLIKFGPPVACYNWSDADNGGSGTVIDFDASCSWDDVEIVLYEWDWDDNGVFDYVDSDPFCSYDYGDTDIHNCTLRVSDSEGNNNSITHIVQAWVNNPPNFPSDPDPPDNATNVSIDTDLSWTGGDPDPEDTVTYDVYFGDMSPPLKVAWNLTETTYDPGTLDDETTYYWQIIAWDNHDTSTPGPIWSFTTEEINDPPAAPDIDGPTSGSVGTEYDYTFVSNDPEEDDIYYYIDWGDNTNTGWIGLYNSGEEITQSHTWSIESTYTIRAKAKDIHGAIGEWGTLEVEMPLDQHSINSLFFQSLERLAERFPMMERIFSCFSFWR